MANITVKLFGVLRVDTKLGATEISVDSVEEIFNILNAKIDDIYMERVKTDSHLQHPDKITFKDVICFINGNRCTKKKTKLKDGDEVWFLSPASGG